MVSRIIFICIWGLLFACKTPTYPFYEPYGLTVWFSEDTLKRGENVYLTLRFKNTYDSATVFYPNAWIMLSHYDNSSITESYLDNIERGFYPLNSVTDTTSSMQLNPLEVATLKFKITVDTPFFYTDGANPIEVVYRYTELDKSKKKSNKRSASKEFYAKSNVATIFIEK